MKSVADGRVMVASPALEPVDNPHGRNGCGGGGRAILGVRSQYLRPGDAADRGCLHGRTTLVERLGSETVLNVELTSGGRIVVAIEGDATFQLGAGIAVGFDPEHEHLFSAD